MSDRSEIEKTNPYMLAKHMSGGGTHAATTVMKESSNRWWRLGKLIEYYYQVIMKILF